MEHSKGNRSNWRKPNMEPSSGYGPKPELSEARADEAAGRQGAPIRFALVLKRFVDHPIVKLGVGLILIASGLIEAYDTVLDDFHRLRIRVGHGVVILAVRPLSSIGSCDPRT